MAERSGLQNGRITAGSPLLCGSGEQCSDGKGGFQGRPLSWVQEDIFCFARCDLSRVWNLRRFCLARRPACRDRGTCFSFCSLRVFASGFAFPAGRPFSRRKFFRTPLWITSAACPRGFCRRRGGRVAWASGFEVPTRSAWPRLRQERPDMVLRRFMSRSGGSPNTRLYSLLNCVTLS